MSQDKVEDYLRANPGWHSAEEISKALRIGRGSVSKNLSRLRIWNLVETRGANYTGKYEWRFKKNGGIKKRKKSI